MAISANKMFQLLELHDSAVVTLEAKDRHELRILLERPSFLKALGIVYLRCRGIPTNLLQIDPTDPAALTNLAQTQGIARGYVEVISQLVDLSLEPADEETDNDATG